MSPDDWMQKLDLSAKSPILWRRGESWLIYCADYLPGEVFAELDLRIAWQQDAIKIFGRSIPLPRLTAWYGDPGASYAYSGIWNEAKPWIDSLSELRLRLNNDLGVKFNSVLANRYADGTHHQGYHADDEKELGTDPLIASLSFGAMRRFLVKSRMKGDHAGETTKFDLESGSLLLMGGALQREYLHAIGKTKKPLGPRINLTFRSILLP